MCGICQGVSITGNPVEALSPTAFHDPMKPAWPCIRECSASVACGAEEGGRRLSARLYEARQLQCSCPPHSPFIMSWGSAFCCFGKYSTLTGLRSVFVPGGGGGGGEGRCYIFFDRTLRWGALIPPPVLSMSKPPADSTEPAPGRSLVAGDTLESSSRSGLVVLLTVLSYTWYLT